MVAAPTIDRRRRVSIIRRVRLREIPIIRQGRRAITIKITIRTRTTTITDVPKVRPPTARVHPIKQRRSTKKALAVHTAKAFDSYTQPVTY